MARIPKRLPRDLNSRAVAIAKMAIGEDSDNIDPRSVETIAAKQGRASKGGHARSSSLSPKRRREIAAKAATARWKANK